MKLMTRVQKAQESKPKDKRRRAVPRSIFYLIAILIHGILFITISIQTADQQEAPDTSIFKLVDVAEYIPEPEPEPEEVEPPPPEQEILEVDPVDGPAEDIEITEKTVVQLERPIEYLPQHQISVPPGIPARTVLANIVYPPLANRQRIEGVVYLELFIDARGNIRDIKILREPGFGLGEAAVKAFEGITCTPAMANGEPVAVRFRYPVRFELR